MDAQSFSMGCGYCRYNLYNCCYTDTFIYIAFCFKTSRYQESKKTLWQKQY